MEKAVFAIYDKVADTYGDPMAFENQMLGIAQMRREVRDLYIKGDINYDSLKDKQFVMIGRYYPKVAEYQPEDIEYAKNVEFAKFVEDLIEGEKDEI